MTSTNSSADGDDPNMPTVPGPDGLPMKPPAVPPMPADPESAGQPAGTLPPQDMPISSSPPPMPHPATSVPSDAQTNNLLELKQQALQNLAPLVDHLEQTPEERFKTTMMMLQASDNPALVKEAYVAANQIADEKLRAQALLDVVNEINYFTQHNAAANGGAAADNPL